MDDVQKKVYADIIGHPFILIPGTVGLSCLFLSAVVGWLPLFGLGLAGCLTAGGALATRLIFKLEYFTEKAFKLQQEEKLAARELSLDQLDDKLARDGDKRTHRALRSLRELYTTLKQDVKEGKLTGNTARLLARVDALFAACVENLNHAYELYEALNRLTGKAKTKAIAHRDQLVEEVVESVDHLSEIVQQYHALNANRSSGELSQLREELDQTLRVAEAVEGKRSKDFEEEKGYNLEKFRSRIQKE